MMEHEKSSNSTSHFTVQDLLLLAFEGKRRKPPIDKNILFVEFSGEPSWMHASKITSFWADMEQLFGKPLELVAGGDGCVWAYFDVGILMREEASSISRMINGELKEKIRERYGATQVRLIIPNSKQMR
ncbi:MAG: hypothetical protein NW217_10810 [Hyphomicrobiaceae bacterium]|nr:hypothetical protein [Hyphomicrobiaceae bacterium]